jgi:hypothetical protein
MFARAPDWGTAPAPTDGEVLKALIQPLADHVKNLQAENKRLRETQKIHETGYSAAIERAAELEKANAELQQRLKTVNSRCADLLEAQLHMRKEADPIIKLREPGVLPEFMEMGQIVSLLCLYARQGSTEKPAGDVLADKMKTALECYFKAKAMAPVAQAR